MKFHLSELQDVIFALNALYPGPAPWGLDVYLKCNKGAWLSCGKGQREQAFLDERTGGVYLGDFKQREITREVREYLERNPRVPSLRAPEHVMREVVARAERNIKTCVKWRDKK